MNLLTSFFKCYTNLTKTKATNTEQYWEELVCDAFINGMALPLIYQRMFENKSFDLGTV